MISNLRPYPAYKDSGVPWLGKVPEYWELKPLKRWVRINASVLPDTTPADYEFRYIDIGTVGRGFLTREPQQLRFGNAPSRARRVLHIGDTIISTVRTYLKAVYYVGGDAEALVCSTGFAVLTPGPSTQPKYVSYLVQSNTFTDRVTAESVGTAYPAIAEWRLGSFYVPFPPLPEQTAIVRFLDYIDRRIRRYIRAKQKLIKLLEEYKQTLIHQAVTGRIDVRTGQPYPAYKDSGVEWLAQVPEHWEVRRLKHICRREQNGSTPPTDRPDYYADSGLPWYTPPSLGSDVVIGEATRFLTDLAVHDGKARIIEPPALAVSVIGNVGRSALILSRGATNQQITCFELNQLVCQPKFVTKQFRLAESYLVAAASSATIPILDSLHLRQTSLALPPLPEQTAIVEYLDTQTTKIDTAIGAARREIELLREYCERLIADVVTGKLDVRQIAAQLPEEPPEEEAETFEEEPDESEEPEETAIADEETEHA